MPSLGRLRDAAAIIFDLDGVLIESEHVRRGTHSRSDSQPTYPPAAAVLGQVDLVLDSISELTDAICR
jgi:phosphoglycolate phosphatase-like HAD superfamily hydrolase